MSAKAYHGEGEDCIVFDKAVEPAEKNGYRPQQHVDRETDKVGDQLDEFREDHPCQKSTGGSLSLLGRPI